MSQAWPWWRARAKLLPPRYDVPSSHPIRGSADRGSAANAAGSSAAARNDNAERKQRALPLPSQHAPGRPEPAAAAASEAGSQPAVGKKRRRKAAAAAAASAPPAAAAASASTAAAGGADDGGLDDLFGGLVSTKRAARERAAAAAEEEARAVAARLKAAKREARERNKDGRMRDPVFGEEYDLSATINPQKASVHRFDNASGLNVYKAHALGLGRGGDTPLCPFDCSCCF